MSDLPLYAAPPRPGTFVTSVALDWACAHVRQHHTSGDTLFWRVLDRARALVEQHEWAVDDDGVLTIEGDRGIIYTVSEECATISGTPCPSLTFQKTIHGGECKHILARELIRLAQAFDACVTTTTVASVRLQHALLFLADTPVMTFVLGNGRLRLAAGRKPDYGDAISLRAVTFNHGIITVAVPTAPWLPALLARMQQDAGANTTVATVSLSLHGNLLIRYADMLAWAYLYPPDGRS